jgi:hypothetical protein
MQEPSAANQFQSAHARLLTDSFQRLLNRPLFLGDAQALYHAPFPILSHSTADDPILTYGNLAALKLWEMSWDALTQLPSRLTAEPMERGQRDAMFAQMRQHGFIENYAGVRVSATGRRFEIQNAVIWTLTDENGVKMGEAASFQDVVFL